MGELARVYFIHALSPLHAGVGEGLDVINLPTARERSTDYPFLPGSSVKGVLRDAAESVFGGKHDARVVTAFGPPTERAADARGGLVFSDANLLALPVRSHYGTFAWVTCPYVIRRLARDLAESGAAVPAHLAALEMIDLEKSDGHVAPASALAPAASTTVFLEDLQLKTPAHEAVGDAAHWLAEQIWPAPARPAATAQPSEQQAYSAAIATQTFFERRMLVVNNNLFGYLARNATEVRSRVKIDDERGTAAASGPWTEEHLPTETLLHGLVLARRTRYFAGGRKADDTGALEKGVAKSEADSLEALTGVLAQGARLRFGGKSTGGMGRARLSIVGGV